MLDKSYYNTVLCQTLSPCGKYLLAGNIYGQVAVFDLDRILKPEGEQLLPDFNNPKYIHTLQNEKQTCSLVSSQKFCIIGTVGNIYGYDWKSILTPKLSKPVWSITIPSQTALDHGDVNSLWLSDDESRLYVGCGDNNIYVYNLEDGSLVVKFEGHTDYIHSVHGNGEQLASAGEDGLVKLWDLRSSKAHNSINPHKNSKVSRSDLGKWLGSVSINNDWIICGGGPQLSLWHLRSLDVVTVFDVPNQGIHVSFFHDDQVVAGGTSKHLYQLSFAGEVKVELPVSATTVYSVVMSSTPKVLAIAGSSPDIDLCTSFNYRDQVLSFR